MADDVDLFPNESAELPKGGSLLNESVPVGAQRRAIPKEMAEQICGAHEGQPTVHCEKVGEQMTVNMPVGVARNFLRVVPVGNESVDAAFVRAQRFAKDEAKAKSLPDGTRVLFGKLFEIDPDTKKNVAVGFRTYVVTGDTVLTEKDLESAKAEEMSGTAAVTLTLKPDAAARFETFTGENVMRRLALVVDGTVMSAPVVQGKISGGRLSIALSAAEKSSDAERQEAARLAKALGGK